MDIRDYKQATKELEAFILEAQIRRIEIYGGKEYIINSDISTGIYNMNDTIYIYANTLAY